MNVLNGLATALLPLLDLTVKIAVLVVLAALASFVLRRAASATRHLVWLCALLASIALPAIGVLMPSQIGARWLIPIAPAPTIETAPAKVIEPTIPAASSAKPVVEKTAQTAPAVVAPVATTGEATRTKPAPLAIALVGLYAVGAVIVLLQVVVGGLAVRRLARQAVPVSPESASAQALTVARAAIGDVRSREIRLLQLPEAVPMTWGWLKPTILLPNDAENWDAERLRVVLMHEVAHIARRDWPIQMLVHAICAVYWFHPLVWWAAARLRAESESACDDRVLLAGVAGDTYAGHLLAIAELARRRNADGGVRFVAPMARRGGLHARLSAVMNAQTLRLDRLRRCQVLISGLVVALSTGLLSLIHTNVRAANPNGAIAHKASPMTPSPQVTAVFDSVPSLKEWTAPVGKDGIVELIAIGERDSKPKGNIGHNASVVRNAVESKKATGSSVGFWQPNGAVLKLPLADPLPGIPRDIFPHTTERSVSVYFRVKPDPSHDSKSTASLELATNGASTDNFAMTVIDFKPALPSGASLGAMWAMPSREMKYTDITLKVAAGDWQQTAHVEPRLWSGDAIEIGTNAAKKVVEKMAHTGAVVSVMRPQVKNGEITFTVIDTLLDHDYHVYAVDRHGNRYEPNDKTAATMSNYRHTSVVFRLDRGTTLKDIAYIAYDTRTLHKVSFHHVALYPEGAT